MSGSDSTLRLSIVVDAVTATAVKGLNDVQKAEQGVAQEAARTGTAVSGAAEKLDKVGHSSSAVRRELIVLTHEMSQGNYTRFAGSMLVIGERLDAMKYLMSPVGIGMTALAAAVGSFVYALIKGSAESAQFRDDIKLTGDYAGVTEGQFNALVGAVAAGDGKFAQSRDILEQLVGSGRFTAQSIGAVGLAVAKLSDVSGGDAEKIAGDFAKMTDGVAKWAEEHNRSYHFISAAQYEHIVALEKAGKTQEAVLFTSQALYAHLGGDAPQQLGLLGSAWHSVATAINEAWDAMKGWGRDTTVEEQIASQTAQIAELEAQIKKAKAAGNTGFASDLEGDVQKLRDGLVPLQSKKAADERAAQRQSANDQLQQTKIDWDKQIEATRDAHQKMLDEVAKYKATYQKLVGLPGPTGITQEKFDAGLDAITQKEADALATAHAGMITSIAQADAALARSEANRAKTQLDEQLKANQISIQQYYAQRQAIEERANASERRSRQAELGATRSTPVRDGAEAERQKGKEYQIESQLRDLDEQRVAAAKQLNAERDQALKTLDKEIADAIAAGGRHELDGADQKQALERQYNDLIDRARQSRPEDVGPLSKALGLREAQVDLDVVTRKAQNLLADLQGRQVMVQAQVQTGEITPEAGRADLEKASEEAIKKLQAARADLVKQLQDATDKGLDTTGIVRSLDDVQKKIGELSETPMKKLLQGWGDTTSAMESATTHWMDGAANALTNFVTTGKLNFRDFAVSILKDLAEIEIKALAAQLILGSAGGSGGLGIFGALIGAFAGASGGTAAGAGAGASAAAADSVMIAAAGGGRVSGPGTRTSDSIRAWLSDGEFVVKADAVARPGVLPLLHAINGDHLTQVKSVRLASGGLVGSGLGSPGAPDQSGLNVSISAPLHLNAASGISQADGEALQRKLIPQMHQLTRAVMINEMRPGGILEKLSPAAQ